MKTNKVIAKGSELQRKGQALLEAAFEYWQQYQKDVGLAAVVWLEGDNRHFVLFTRSEYKRAIMNEVDSLGDDEPAMFEPFTKQPPPAPAGERKQLAWTKDDEDWSNAVDKAIADFEQHPSPPHQPLATEEEIKQVFWREQKRLFDGGFSLEDASNGAVLAVAARIRSEPPAEIGIFCQHVTDILDGKDDGSGLNYEPWGALRKRLVELVKKPAGFVLPSRNVIAEKVRSILDAACWNKEQHIADYILSLSQPQQPKGGVP